MAYAKDMETCKNGLGHKWDQIPSTRKPPFGAYMWMRCERCTCVREDIVQFPGDGRLLARSYYHPAGYDEIPKISREEWRVAQFNAAKKKSRNRALKAV